MLIDAVAEAWGGRIADTGLGEDSEEFVYRRPGDSSENVRFGQLRDGGKRRFAGSRFTNPVAGIRIICCTDEETSDKYYVKRSVIVAKRIVLIGAGSAMFGLGSVGNVYKSEILAGSEIVLHDINPEALARVEKTARTYLEEHGLPFKLTATVDRGEALRGADFCIIAIESGDRYTLWEQEKAYIEPRDTYVTLPDPRKKDEGKVKDQ